MTLLAVQALCVRYPGGTEAVEGVDFEVAAGQRVAIVGESGAGKTTIARAVAGLLPQADVSGSVRFAGQELLGMPEPGLRALRWRRLAYAPQGAPFNPVATIESALTEPLQLHLGMSAKAARKRAAQLTEEVGLDAALLARYPHQLSGGQLRLLLLAMTLSCEPELVLLDEPVAGLDALSAQRLLSQLQRAAHDRGFALIVISHDLPAASSLCDRTLVLYAGQVVEAGPTAPVVARARHPYTWALVNAFPVMNTSKDLRPIRGSSPDLHRPPSGCRFHPRCQQAEERCRHEPPALAPVEDRQVRCLLGGVRPLVQAESLVKTYRVGGLASRRVAALAGVSFEILPGEVLGVVGPSGSGKSTLARVLAGALAPDSGRLLVAMGDLSRPATGETGAWQLDLAALPERRSRELRRRIQLISQDPADSLSPRLHVLELVREPLDISAEMTAPVRRAACEDALARAGMEPTAELLAAYAHELSGGQQQRVAVARALVCRPRLLIADEPTSMLDASEQARLMQLLRELQVERGMGMMLVSHDIALVRKAADRIVVLDEGEIVEEGPSGRVSSAPRSALARRLVEAAPVFISGPCDAEEPPRERS